MIVLYFFEVSRIAHYGAAVNTRDDLTFVPVSNRVDVDSALDSRIVNAILVPARSADSWFAVENQIAPRISMPRILVVTSPERSTLWNSRLAEESGFDGLVLHDPLSPISDFAQRFTRSVLSCTTAGARKPEKLSGLTRCPSVEEISHGDDLNVRILHLMSIGQTHEEIAQRLERAAQTVRNRMSNMIQRAGVRNHTELVITYEQAIARQAILIESTSS